MSKNRSGKMKNQRVLMKKVLKLIKSRKFKALPLGEENC